MATLPDGSATERLLRRDRAITGVAMAVIFGLAALYTLFGIGMPMSAIETTKMADPSIMIMIPAIWSAGYAALIFAMWWFMMIAMMVPSAAPTVLLYAMLARRTDRRGAASRLAAVFLAGYLAVWAAFSLFATGLQWLSGLHGLVSPATMMLTSSLLGGALLLGAGIYQLGPLKQACLEHCRSPMQFLVERRRPGAFGVFRMGLEHGAYCLGCCWFLMILLFVGGIMNLYWIVGLALFVAIEKLIPTGRMFSRASGIAMILAGSWLIWQP